MIEIKRRPYRVITLTERDAADVQDAISHVQKLLDRELAEATKQKDEKAINQMVKERSTLHTLLVAAIEI